MTLPAAQNFKLTPNFPAGWLYSFNSQSNVAPINGLAPIVLTLNDSYHTIPGFLSSECAAQLTQLRQLPTLSVSHQSYQYELFFRQVKGTNAFRLPLWAEWGYFAIGSFLHMDSDRPTFNILFFDSCKCVFIRRKHHYAWHLCLHQLAAPRPCSSWWSNQCRCCWFPAQKLLTKILYVLVCVGVQSVHHNYSF